MIQRLNNIQPGRYLTIEKPILTVSKMMQIISGRSIRAVNIPFLPIILKGIANILFVFSFFGKIDVKITPNRVKKLFIVKVLLKIFCLARYT